MHFKTCHFGSNNNNAFMNKSFINYAFASYFVKILNCEPIHHLKGHQKIKDRN